MKTNIKSVFFASLILMFGIIITYINDKNKKDVYLNKIKDNVYWIKNTSCLNRYLQRGYISVVYAELKNNYDYLDKLDYVRAKYGFDPSIGFAQIRVSTFYWIEDNSNNPLIKKSKDRDDLLNKITTDSISILYSAEYIKMINNLFIRKYGKHASIKSLGSYYSAGIDYGKDNVDSSYSNIVGETAEEFYYSNKLIEEFPY